MSTNENLHISKRNKNDEYYTRLEDIEKELLNYSRHFCGMTIYCNCDNPKYSMFWKYFYDNFEKLKLKRLISTYYENNGYAVATIFDGIEVCTKYLNGNGDFRSNECISFLIDADIVVTNPPFSLARDYINLLMENNKKFLIVGDMNWIKYKQIFPLLRNNKIWLGNNYIKKFILPDGTEKTFGNKLWFTNLDTNKRHKHIPLTIKYDQSKYPVFDNYNAINIDRVSDIPYDYSGIMGVPISFMTKYCPEQFNIVGFRKGVDGKDLVFTKGNKTEYPFTRILIQRI